MGHYRFWTYEADDGSMLWSFDDKATWHETKLNAWYYALHRDLLVKMMSA